MSIILHGHFPIFPPWDPPGCTWDSASQEGGEFAFAKGPSDAFVEQKIEPIKVDQHGPTWSNMDHGGLGMSFLCIYIYM